MFFIIIEWIKKVAAAVIEKNKNIEIACLR